MSSAAFEVLKDAACAFSRALEVIARADVDDTTPIGRSHIKSLNRMLDDREEDLRQAALNLALAVANGTEGDHAAG